MNAVSIARKGKDRQSIQESHAGGKGVIMWSLLHGKGFQIALICSKVVILQAPSCFHDSGDLLRAERRLPYSISDSKLLSFSLASRSVCCEGL